MSRGEHIRSGGGHWWRILETIHGFKAKYKHWPTKLRLPSAALRALRDIHLTPRGVLLLESKLQIMVAEDEKLICEDDAGLTFDYAKDGASGTKPHSAAEEWLCEP
jgi:hypothetical protein